MANPTKMQRGDKRDEFTENETLQRNNQPTGGWEGKGANIGKRGDGISRPIPETNGTRAPGQFGNS